MATDQQIRSLPGGWTRKQWGILLAMTGALGLVLFDTQALAVALPTIQGEFGAPWPWVQWVLSSYFLTMAGLSIACGRLSDLFGNRAVFCWGVGILMLSSLFGGCANGTVLLILARSLQGIGAALIWPSSMSLIIGSFPLEERGRAIGVTSALTAVIVAMGPLVSGLFTEYFSWRWIFWINVPICVASFTLVIRNAARVPRLDETFDVWGFLSLFVGGLSVIVSMLLVKQIGWGHPAIHVLLTVGGIGLFCVHFTSRFAKHPFVDLTIFRNRRFVGGTLIGTCSQFVMVTTIYWGIFLQKSLLLPPLHAGLFIVFASAPALVMNPLSGYLSDKLGPKVPAIIGYFCILFSTVIAWGYTVTNLFPVFILALFVFGCGSSFIFTPTAVATFSALPEGKRGVAYATYNAVRNIGTVVSVALLGSMNNWVRMGGFSNFLAENPFFAALDPRRVVKAISWVGSTSVDLPSGAFELLREKYLYFSFQALNVMNGVIAVIAIVAIVLAITYLKPYSLDES